MSMNNEHTFDTMESGSTTSTSTSLGQYFEYSAIKEHLTWYGQIKDPQLLVEYHKFQSFKRSDGFILAISVVFTFLMLPLYILILIADIRTPSNSKFYAVRFFSAFLALSFVFFSAVSGWLVYFNGKKLHLDRFFSTNTLKYGEEMQQRISNYACFRFLRKNILTKPMTFYASTLFVGCMQFFFVIIFVRRAFNINCLSNPPSIVLYYGAGTCYPADALPYGCLVNAIMMFSIPILLFINLPDTSIIFVWFNFFLSVGLFIWVTIELELFEALILKILLWLLICYFTILDIQIRNLLVFFANLRLRDTYRENEQVLKMEMRHLIANVAHDLKTPLSSFMAGIDLIQMAFEQYENETSTVHSMSTSIKSIQNNIRECFTSIRNTNLFMLMTINRCIDYTKASKGLELVPKYETIDLLETLNLPLDCMHHIQNRIQITLKDLDMTKLCTHIITDKQWLQENLLCLLSNAVKYSSQGSVTVAVYLEEITSSHLLEADTHPETEKIINEMKPNALFSQHYNLSNSKIVPRQDSKNMTGNLIPSSPTSQLFLRIEVEDTGIGINPKAMEELFNPFKKIQRLSGGTGLGLYSLARRVEALKGRYGVMPRRDKTQGSLFWLSIPYKPDHDMALLSPGNRNPKIEEIPINITEQTAQIIQRTEIEQLKMDPLVVLNHQKINTTEPNEPAIETRLSKPPTPHSSKKNSSGSSKHFDILLVDDSVAILKMNSMVLTKLGHSVKTAENGDMAVKEIKDRWKSTQTFYDIILMDLQMPVMDGLEATKRIREFEIEITPKEQTTKSFSFYQPIIGMSANSDHETMEAAFASGVDSFIAKPFKTNSLLEQIQKVLVDLESKFISPT